MWSVKSEILKNDAIKYKIYTDKNSISLKDWCTNIQESESFLEFFLSILISNEYAGYYFEVKPYNIKNIKDPFEFVLVKSTILPSIEANSFPFKEFLDTDKDVVSFKNLRKDATLIVPNNIADSSIYAHLAVFCRKAPQKQLFALWKLTAQTYFQELSENNKWLSTAGLGVNWLHIRIDSKPKYYRHLEYKTIK